MASQIEQLRASFDKMNTVQKKQFIDKLKIQLQNNKSTEHIKFLNECVAKYNTAAPVPTPTAPAGSPVPTKSKQKNPLKVAVIALSVILVAFLIGGGLFVFLALNNYNTGGNGGVSGKNDNENIIGEWKKLDKDGKVNILGVMYEGKFVEIGQTYVFKRDGSYKYIVPQINHKGIITTDLDYALDEGIYELKGTTLTLHSDIDGKDKTYNLEFDGDDDFALNGKEWETFGRGR